MCKLLMNLHYKQILARFRREQNTDTQYVSTVAAQRAYMLPPSFLRPQSVSFNHGNVSTPLEHVQSEDLWNEFTSYTRTEARPARFFIRQRFGAFGAEILLDPVPSVVGTLTVSFEATDRDLAATAYTTGTVTVTPGNATITGASTTFTPAMVGRYFTVTSDTGDGWWYRISSYSSATVLGLETLYEGHPGAGASAQPTLSYKIAEAFGLPEEMQILPVYYFLQHYFSQKQRKDKVEEFLGLHTSLLQQAQRDYNSKDGKARVFNASKYQQSAWPIYPGHFPQNVT